MGMEKFNFTGKFDFGKKMNIIEDYGDGFTHKDTSFLIIGDGMGGSKGTDVASYLAFLELKKYIETFITDTSFENIELELKKALYMVNHMIFNYNRLKPEMYKNFLTTISIIAMKEDNSILICHAGDTRIYLFRKINDSDTITQLTKDNVKARELLDNRTITEQEYSLHPDRHVITKALGLATDFEPTFQKGKLLKNDIILLCTNGLYEMLTKEQIQKIILSVPQNEVCDYLVQAANEIGGIDNIGCLVSYIN